MRGKKSIKFLVLLLAVLFCAYMPIGDSAMNRMLPMSTVEAASIKLNTKTETVVIGKTVTLTVSGTKKTVTWSSSNTSVATVNSKGVVTGKKAGTATIKAKVSGKTLTCNVTVKESPKLNFTKRELYVGTGKTLKVNGTNKSVKWSTSDSSVVTVTQKGKITAKKVGKAVVTATVGTKKLKCNVTVKNRITVQSKDVTVEEGKTVNLKVKFVGDGNIYWKCGNTSVAQPQWTKKWNGDYTTLKIKGLKSGKTYVTLTNSLNDETVKIKVTVKSHDEMMADKVKITLKNKLPQTFSDYYYSGRISSSYTLTGFSYETKYYEFSDDYTVYLYFSGEKIYDSDGTGQSKSVKIGWKLYDEEGYVVDSGTAYTSSIAMGDKFKNQQDYVFDIKEPGNYVLEILNTN